MKFPKAFGEIRSILHGEPSIPAWVQLMRLVSQEDPGEQHNELVPYIDGHTSTRWPSVLRPVPTAYLKTDIKEGPWMQLCRTLTLSKRFTPRRLEIWVEKEFIKTITHIKIEEDGAKQFTSHVLFKSLELPPFQHIDSLVLPDRYIHKKKQWNQFLDAPSLQALKEFKMRGSTDKLKLSKVELFSRKQFQHLEHVAIGSILDNETLIQLIKDGHCPPLKSINFDGQYIGSELPFHMSKEPKLANLEYLSLYNGNLTDTGLEHIATSKYINKLKYMNVGGCSLTEKAYEIVSNSTNFQHLELLWIWSCPTTPANLNDLLNSTNLPKLERLNLNNNAMTQSHLQVIANSKQWPLIKTLYLNSGNIGDEHIAILLENQDYLELSDFEANANDCTNKSCLLIAEHPGLKNLHRLQLHTTCDKKTITAVHDSPNLPLLKYAYLTTNPVLNSWIDDEQYWPDRHNFISETYEAKRSKYFSEACTDYDYNFDQTLLT